MNRPHDEIEQLSELEPPDALDAIVRQRAHHVLEAHEASRVSKPASKESAAGGLLWTLRRALR